jgi:hypothetical protein
MKYVKKKYSSRRYKQVLSSPTGSIIRKYDSHQFGIRLTPQLMFPDGIWIAKLFPSSVLLGAKFVFFFGMASRGPICSPNMVR